MMSEETLDARPSVSKLSKRKANKPRPGKIAFKPVSARKGIEKMMKEAQKVGRKQATKDMSFKNEIESKLMGKDKQKKMLRKLVQQKKIESEFKKKAIDDQIVMEIEKTEKNKARDEEIKNNEKRTKVMCKLKNRPITQLI